MILLFVPAAAAYVDDDEDEDDVEAVKYACIHFFEVDGCGSLSTLIERACFALGADGALGGGIKLESLSVTETCDADVMVHVGGGNFFLMTGFAAPNDEKIGTGSIR